jgi:hypothetical protein
MGDATGQSESEQRQPATRQHAGVQPTNGLGCFTVMTLDYSPGATGRKTL